LSSAAEQANERLTFSFGENWRSFVATISTEALDGAVRDLTYWLDPSRIAGKSVLDIGSGSGLHSLAFHQLGAGSVRSFDMDPKSVEATTILWHGAGAPASWQVTSGSILDDSFVTSLGKFDIVYCWGVLHHTGELWEAMRRTVELVEPGGCLWLAIYVSGPNYAKHLATKRRYNRASLLGKRVMEALTVSRWVLGNARRTRNPLKWLPEKERGMNYLHDTRDWLGGLPYEVASADEVVTFCRKHGLVLDRIATAPEGSCTRYLFSR
jgi:2-polyprenyl-6-hydroxyphenyl methylase/3-demethylubiquinone-9 3-methyltransferase